MSRKSTRLITVLSIWLAALTLAVPSWGSAIGTPVAIGGHAADIALDEARGVLYIANFTANRIDVMSLGNLSVQTSINVAPFPASIAMSPDGRHLLVTHYANFEQPAAANNALTVIDLETRGKQTFALGSPALGVAFGNGPRALVVTASDFSLFDPVTGTSSLLYTISDLAATSLPVPPLSFPANITKTSMAVSGDGTKIYGLTDTFEFGYDYVSGWLKILGYTSEPEQGPRVMSVNQDGSRYLAGWVLHGGSIWNSATGVWNLAQFPNAEGVLEIGSHAIDDSRGLVYAQVSVEAEEADTSACGITGDCPLFVNKAPTLQVLNGENLAVLESFNLTENLAGKSLISSDHSTMYSVSDSGVLVIPLSILDTAPRIVADKQDVFFHSNFCDRSVMIQDVVLYDPSGGTTDFSLTVDNAGVQVTPQIGVTPATVQVRVDPSAYQNTTGNDRELYHDRFVRSGEPAHADQGAGECSAAGSARQRRQCSRRAGGHTGGPVARPFYVLRQDTNQVLAFDGNSYSQIAALSTGNTPTQMAITFDRRWLLVGHDNSQYIAVFDLDTLEASIPIRMPGGHYPRSVAASANGILAANRVSGPIHTIDRVDIYSRTAQQLPTPRPLGKRY
jgi:DNA-binding beta-propeller fold protein YncE